MRIWMGANAARLVVSTLGRLRGAPWARALRDGSVIVFSILLAFVVNSEHAKYKERREEQILLTVLQEEFETNRRTLVEIRSNYQAMSSAASRLLELAGPDPTGYRPETVDSLIGVIAEIWTYSPATGALDAVINAGKFRLIRSDSLRLELGSWRGVLEDYEEEGRWGREQLMHYVIPFLSRHTSFAGVSQATGWWADLPAGSFTTDHTAVLANREFENIALARFATARNILDDSAELLSAIDRILALIGQEIRD